MDQNESKWTNMEPKGHQKRAQASKTEPKAFKMEQKLNQKHQKCTKRRSPLPKKNNVQERSAPGRQPSFGVFGLDRIFVGAMVNNDQVGIQIQCPNSSTINAKTGTEKNTTIIQTLVFKLCKNMDFHCKNNGL